jgi:hypothetical protein
MFLEATKITLTLDFTDLIQTQIHEFPAGSYYGSQWSFC